MLKRIEFSLNLNDPYEARIYRALQPSLRYRRGGAIIRQALGDFFETDEKPSRPAHNIRVSDQEKAVDQA